MPGFSESVEAVDLGPLQPSLPDRLMPSYRRIVPAPRPVLDVSGNAVPSGVPVTVAALGQPAVLSIQDRPRRGPCGYLLGDLQGAGPSDRLRLAVAYGSAAAGLPGTTISTLPTCGPSS